jgi:hypothetical protein
MKSSKIMIVGFCLGALGATLAPRAWADEWDKQTIVTFNEPVEIPGMVLPAGSYLFRLADSDSDRNIVQVFNGDETHLYATLLAIPDYRMHPSGKTAISFEERAAKSPEAIKAWFYPGDKYGREFVYPKARAVELAQAVKQPVKAMPSEMSRNISTPAKSMAEPQVVAMKKAPVEVVTPPQMMAQAMKPNLPVTPEPATAHKRLPKTASNYPLVALAGLLSLGAAAGLRLAGKVSA